AQLLTTQATQQLFGGAPVVGQATKSVLIAPAAAPKPTTPSKVRNLKVTGVSTNTVSLNWDAPSDTGASAIAGYVVKWAGPTSGQVSVQANTTNANIGTLTANSSYTFSVLATNLQGWGDPVSVTQNTANTPAPAPTPPPLQQQTLVGPAWEGGGPKVKSGKWKTFNDTANLDTNAGQEARLKAKNKSASIKSVKFRYKGDFVEVRAVLKPGKKKGSFTLHESAPAVPGYTSIPE
ncbi:MAG: fibronectin type III domain-containing protein, partial [Actinomycetota bacterium]